MKPLVIAAFSALVFACPAFALVGGPWDNNIPGGTPTEANGTYQGVITGKNLSGVMMFGTATTSTTGGAASLSGTSGIFNSSGSEGRIAIFTNGVLVVGEMAAVVDLPAQSVSASFDGSRLRSVQSLTRTSSSVVNVPEVIFDGTVVNTTKLENTTQQATLNDVVNIAGFFGAKFNQTFPTITFAGKGELTITQPDLNAPNGPVADEVTPEPAQTNADGTVTTAWMTRTVPLLDPDPALQNIKIRVSGAKTSELSPTFTGSVTVEQPSVSAWK
ncbi:MAG: hypothetical protein WCP06_10395 [Verrucomicrobiota bacterium]